MKHCNSRQVWLKWLAAVAYAIVLAIGPALHTDVRCNAGCNDPHRGAATGGSRPQDSPGPHHHHCDSHCVVCQAQHVGTTDALVALVRRVEPCADRTRAEALLVPHLTVQSPAAARAPPVA